MLVRIKVMRMLLTKEKALKGFVMSWAYIGIPLSAAVAIGTQQNQCPALECL